MRFHHAEYDFLDTTRRALASVADRFAEARLTLVEDLPRGPLTAWGDANRLQRAITQLLDNAAKFTPKGGPSASGCARCRPARPAATTSCASPTPAPASARTGCTASSSRSTRSTAPSPASTAAWAWGSPSPGARARGLGGDVRVGSPSTEIIEGVRLGGAAFYLAVATRAPVDGGEVRSPFDSRPDPEGGS